MLRLREIEIFGFKSFADRTRIPLPEDLLVIVGPNGSGKSNVADAVLWALGEQSAKSLRGQKMQDVIFGGSHKRPPAGMAEVILTFQDTDGLKVLIARRLMRTGESTYLMDGHAVRRKDVQDFLMRYAISTQGSFLVEQGRVEALLVSSPEERRMIFEEVAGIAHYKENRRSALHKLDATQGNLLRLNDVIAEVEVRMGSLKRQAAKAERFVRLSDELRSRRRRFWGRAFARYTGRKKALERDLALLKTEKERRETILAQQQADLEQARMRLSEHETSLQALIGAIHEKELASERAEQENKRRTEQILSSRQRLRQIATDREELKARTGRGEAEREALEQALESLRVEQENADGEADRAQAFLEESRMKLEALQAAQEGLRGKSFTLAQEHSRMTAVMSRLDDDLRKQGERERQIAREEESLAARERAVEESLEDLTGRRDEAEESLAVTRRTREEAERNVARLQGELEQASAGLAAARQKLAVTENSLKVLEEHQASLTSSAHAYLNGKAPDRAGTRLAEMLSAVPEALVAPLAAVLGDLLEGYPESPWNGLPDVLSDLRDQRAGQAVFFLEGERTPAAPHVKEPAGFAGWLHEAEGIPGPVRNLLPVVALVETAEQARTFALSAGFGAVTLDGLYVHPDGWVRGGAGGEGGASLLDYERERHAAEEQIEADRELLERSLEEEVRLREALSQARASLEELREREEAGREAALVVQREWERTEGESRRLAASRELLEGEAAQAREERESWEEQRAVLAARLSESEKNRADTEEAIRTGEETLLSARDAQEAAHEAVAASRTRQGEVGQRYKAALESLEKSRAYLEQLADTDRRLAEEVGALEGRIDGLTKAVTEGDQSLRTLLLALEESRERKTRFEDDLRRLGAEVQSLEQQVKQSRETVDEAREEVNRHDLSLASVDSDIRHLVERMGEVFEESPDDLAAECADEPPLSPEEHQEEQRALGRLEEKIQGLGAVNMLAREEYAELESRFNFLAEQRSDLEESVASLQETIRKINRTTRERFMEAFNAVKEHFTHLFKQVFEGGEARLTLLDEANPLETGVEIFAQPPGKKLQSLQLLSGGEKAMVALALLFSLFRYRPQPFFILDEVDAPLDEANINRFNRLLTQFRGQTQFMVVSHNKRTMELAQVLYGVTMAEGGVSKMVSVRMAEVAERLGIAQGG